MSRISPALARTTFARRGAGRTRVVDTLVGTAGLTPAFPEQRPDLRQLLNLALSPDAETASMACHELRRRLDRQQETAP